MAEQRAEIDEWFTAEPQAEEIIEPPAHSENAIYDEENPPPSGHIPEPLDAPDPNDKSGEIGKVISIDRPPREPKLTLVEDEREPEQQEIIDPQIGDEEFDEKLYCKRSGDYKVDVVIRFTELQGAKKTHMTQLPIKNLPSNRVHEMIARTLNGPIVKERIAGICGPQYVPAKQQELFGAMNRTLHALAAVSTVLTAQKAIEEHAPEVAVEEQPKAEPAFFGVDGFAVGEEKGECFYCGEVATLVLCEFVDPNDEISGPAVVGICSTSCRAAYESCLHKVPREETGK